MKALDRQLLLQLILVKYYLSSRWTPRRHLFEKSSTVSHTIWVIAVSSKPPHSNPRCILSFPVTYEEGKQLCLTYNHFFPPPMKKNFAHRIMLCASRMASAVKVPLSGGNSFFPVISLGCGVEPLFRGFALPHLCGVIKPPQRTFVKEKGSGLGC